jgi:hypothetical protein
MTDLAVRVFDVTNLGSVPARAAEPPRTLALPDKPSIAVLPFQNMSGDPEQEASFATHGSSSSEPVNLDEPLAEFPRQTARTAMRPLNATESEAAITLLSQQEATMLKHDSENTAPEVLTDEQLEVVSAGLIIGPAWEVPAEPVPTEGRPTRPGVFV